MTLTQNDSMADLNMYATGIQHIGIPTNDIEKTVTFYRSLGFKTALRTENKAAGEKVAFLGKWGEVLHDTRPEQGKNRILRKALDEWGNPVR